MEPETVADSNTEVSFDMDAAVERIGSQLGLPDPVAPEEPEALAPAPPEISAAAPMPESPAPKSWPKEMHEHWGKTPKEVQSYWDTREKQMLDGLEQYKTDAQMARQFHTVLQPFQPILQAQGLNAPQAVQYLLNAHQRLTQGSEQSRRAAYDELGRSLGMTAAQVAQATQTQAPVDPALSSLQQQMQAIQADLTARQQQEAQFAHQRYQEAQVRTTKEVEAFASDPAHAHFEEVADDIVLLLKTGLPLQEAYEKAVWANPLTREKNLQARLLSETEKQKETARLNALPKARALRSTIRSVDSRRTPTEPLGKMEDTIKATLQEMRQRVH